MTQNTKSTALPIAATRIRKSDLEAADGCIPFPFIFTLDTDPEDGEFNLYMGLNDPENNPDGTYTEIATIADLQEALEGFSGNEFSSGNALPAGAPDAGSWPFFILTSSAAKDLHFWNGSIWCPISPKAATTSVLGTVVLGTPESIASGTGDSVVTAGTLDFGVCLSLVNKGVDIGGDCVTALTNTGIELLLNAAEDAVEGFYINGTEVNLTSTYSVTCSNGDTWTYNPDPDGDAATDDGVWSLGSGGGAGATFVPTLTIHGFVQHTGSVDSLANDVHDGADDDGRIVGSIVIPAGVTHMATRYDNVTNLGVLTADFADRSLLWITKVTPGETIALRGSYNSSPALSGRRVQLAVTQQSPSSSGFYDASNSVAEDVIAEIPPASTVFQGAIIAPYTASTNVASLDGIVNPVSGVFEFAPLSHFSGDLGGGYPTPTAVFTTIFFNATETV